MSDKERMRYKELESLAERYGWRKIIQRDGQDGVICGIRQREEDLPPLPIYKFGVLELVSNNPKEHLKRV